MELDITVDLFRKGAKESVRARQALPVLLKLQERAVQSYTDFRNRNAAPTLGVQFKFGPEDQCVDELAIFGGQTRVISNKALSKKRPKREQESQKSQSSSQATGSAPASPANTSSSDSTSTPSSTGEDLSDVHPSLMDYLAQFSSPTSFAMVDPSQLTVEPLRAMPPQPPMQLPHPASLPSDTMDFLTTLLANPQFDDPSAFFGNTAMPSVGFAPAPPQPPMAEDVVMNDQWTALMQNAGMFEVDGNIQFPVGPANFDPNLFGF